jgi:hypothetical protein
MEEVLQHPVLVQLLVKIRSYPCRMPWRWRGCGIDAHLRFYGVSGIAHLSRCGECEEPVITAALVLTIALLWAAYRYCKQDELFRA